MNKCNQVTKEESSICTILDEVIIELSSEEGTFLTMLRYYAEKG